MHIDVDGNMVIGVLDSIKTTRTTPTDVEASIVAISMVNRIIAALRPFEVSSNHLLKLYVELSNNVARELRLGYTCI